MTLTASKAYTNRLIDDSISVAPVPLTFYFGLALFGPDLLSAQLRVYVQTAPYASKAYNNCLSMPRRLHAARVLFRSRSVRIRSHLRSGVCVYIQKSLTRIYGLTHGESVIGVNPNLMESLLLGVNPLASPPCRSLLFRSRSTRTKMYSLLRCVCVYIQMALTASTG